MPNLWDKMPDGPPQAELNPLTNPTLEQNLGRWAKIYFSTPPAKRERAVSNLLEELKKEQGGAPASQAARPYFARNTRFQDAACSACHHQNPPGHKFCSRCGVALNPAESGPGDGNVDSAAPSQAPPARPQNDVQWLRDTAFGGMVASQAPPRRAWKYLLGALAIGLAGFAYLGWAPGSPWRLGALRTTSAPIVAPQNASPSTANRSFPAASLPVDNSSSAEVERPAETVSPDAKKPEVQNASATAEAPPDRRVPAKLEPAVQRSVLPGAALSPRTPAAGEGGSTDLRLAQRYLGGSTGVRDSTTAAKLLWKAVGEQNTTAAVLLSDLYVRGDGVPKSCDQARLLLVAAVKRGAPQAAPQLRSLPSRGCQ